MHPSHPQHRQGKRTICARMLAGTAYFIATLGGVGRLPWMPGTWATAFTLIVYRLAYPYLSASHYAAIVYLSTVLAISLCHKCAQDIKKNDPPELVIDEWVGVGWTLLPTFSHPPTLLWLLIAFGLFRFFDILKPGPIGDIDRHLHGGIGIILDDVLAGLFSGIILFFIHQCTTIRFFSPLTHALF